MTKFGRGLSIEFVSAVKNGEIKEPFNTADVRAFAKSRGWNSSETYISVLLPNGASETHSHTYQKLFTAVGDGLYVLSDLAKREV